MRMKRILTISSAVIVLAAAVYLLSSAAMLFSSHDEDTAYREAFSRHYKMFAVEIPEKLDFAGEAVPVDQYYVRESLDRELLVNTYWHSNTILMIKRAYRWYPVIQPILKKNNVPDDFFFLCMIESGLEQVVSPAGAAGFWQFLKGTGTSFGLEVGTEVDERYHVVKSTEAACKYLKSAYSKFNSWTLAAASYNMGIEGLDSQLKQQKADNYYDLQLNKETLRYVYRILAVKTIFYQPVRYGFYLRKKDLYPPIPVKTVAVDTTIADFADFCKAHKISYRAFKELNPWLLKSTLTNKERKTYLISLPEEGYTSYEKLQGTEASTELFNDTLKVENIR
jgi:hypothetical protein